MFNQSQIRSTIFAFLLASSSTAFAADEGVAYLFDMPAMTVDDAINIIAQQTNTPAIFPFDQVRLLKTKPLKGNYNLENALSEILDNSGFKAYITESGVITVTTDPGPQWETKKKNSLAINDTKSREHQMKIKDTKNTLLGGVSATIIAATGTPAFAQNSAANILDDEVIVTASIGSRGKPRSSLDSPVAIDSINVDDLLGTGATETGRVLQELVPSFNFSSSSISDGTDSLRPATLRGLGPDQTLVLVNGKRRHKSALVHVNTSVGRGTAGTDINAIPSSALKNVEVLRDGASALYGSDAIAGVINFQLKDSAEDGNITATVGQTYESDGTTYNISANKGFALGEDGFLNLTYEYNNRENTNRAGLTGQCQFLCTTVDGVQIADPATAEREADFERQNFRIGDSDSEGHTIFANLGYDLSENAELYAFGSWGYRENESAGFFRRANAGGDTLLEFFPDGFLPLIRPTIRDTSLVSGIDWTVTDKLTVDTSVGYGRNAYNYEIANSNNVSLGLASPTVFDAGTLELSEWFTNADAVYDLDRYVLAFGAGFRKENYQIGLGEPASFADGGFINEDNINTPELFAPTAGDGQSQVFRGFSSEVDESRDSYSAYAELSADITDRINGQAAVRYEDYEGFGGTFTWKLAALAEVTDWLNLRGSVSTGFRAPSPQQLFFNSTSTQFVTNDQNQTVIEERGTFRNDSPLAQALGIPTLQEEESTSWGLGGVLQPFEGASLTIDYYSIDIDDRIIISGSVPPSGSAEIQAAFDAVGATSAQFFLNGVDTETTGLDIIGSYKFQNPVFGGDLKLTAAANFTDTDVVNEVEAPGLLAGLDLVTPQDVSILEEWQPKDRINVGANWNNDNWGLTLQGSRYGEYTVCEGACDSDENTQTFGSKWLADAQVDYKFDSGVTLSFGGNNIFDTTPDRNLIGQSRAGRIEDVDGNVIVDSDGVFEFSRRSAPFGFNGGYYYGRVSVNF